MRRSLTYPHWRSAILYSSIAIRRTVHALITSACTWGLMRGVTIASSPVGRLIMGRPLETRVVVRFSTAPAITREAFAPLGGFEFRREAAAADERCFRARETPDWKTMSPIS